jgi:hypothetical protein
VDKSLFARRVSKQVHDQLSEISLEVCPKESGNVVCVWLGGNVPNLPITERLSSLPRLDKQALTLLWREFFKADPPLRMRKELMVQFLAYRMQEQEFGALSDRSRRRLKELSLAMGTDKNIPRSRRPAIKPGTRLIRQWKDQVHVVNVEEGSYEYKSTRYDSLSEIARLITGTRWSGPLFFGLKNKAIRNSKEAA